jgi:hypothetical protein
MDEPLLVSIHIPKTAGFTLLQVLAKRFGERLQRAYRAPIPGLRRTETDGWPDIANPACIHGHAVYDRFPWIVGVPDARFITFLREPLASAVSLWRYQRRPHTPWGPVAEAQLFSDDLEEYLLEQHNHNRYRKWIGRSQRSLEEFFFVGVVESFDESMDVLFRLCGWCPIPYGHENRSAGPPPAVSQATAETFRQRSNEDYALWHRAKGLLEERTGSSGS